VTCFAADLDALLAHRVPVRHRIRVRTTNLADGTSEFGTIFELYSQKVLYNNVTPEQAADQLMSEVQAAVR
jgi:hypothetical protein